VEFAVRTLRLTKLYPLAISRGASSGSINLFVTLSEGGLIGIGECAPATVEAESLAATAEASLRSLVQTGALELGPWFTWQKGMTMGIHPAALAAIDIAQWDLLGKKANLPLFRLLGLEKPVAPTSVTVGINSPDKVRDQVREMIFRWRARRLKIKLGSPEGLEHDKESYAAAHEAATAFNVKVRVDANGGWSPEGTLEMLPWLAERDCQFVEQPLAAGMESELPLVTANRPLPVYLDETVQLSSDIPAVAAFIDGVNIKLMKTGGITEAVRAVAVARANGLKTMIGCMSDSSIGIAAGAAIGVLFDQIDLDSHLNQNPDPAEGLQFVAGVVLPTEAPGHGASLVE
jgi:L-Ala-D/L-Glu epimerase